MYAAIWWPGENITANIYIYLVVFLCGYVRILLPVAICTVIFVTTVRGVVETSQIEWEYVGDRNCSDDDKMEGEPTNG